MLPRSSRLLHLPEELAQTLQFLAPDAAMPEWHSLPSPDFFARVSNRLAKHVPVAPFNASLGAGLVTFTFDDVPVSAATRGADILEEHGSRGTYYIAASLLNTYGENWRIIGPDAVVDLHAREHEIGCHSYSHTRADLMSASNMKQDILRNHAILKSIEPTLVLESFAYPFGYSSLPWKIRLNSLFRSSRSVLPLANQGWTDRHYLKAVPLVNRDIDSDTIERLLEETAHSGGWTIFYTHDVENNPSDYGCTPGMVKYALRAANKLGLRVTTVAEGLAAKRRPSLPGQ